MGDHTVVFLSDQGFLPSHISQTQLETELEGVVSQMKSRAAKCPLCTRRGFPSENHVRRHLLQRHLQHFIEQAELAISTERERDQEVCPPPQTVQIGDNNQTRRVPVHSAVSAKSECIYCGKLLHTRSGIRKHQLRAHMMIVFKERIPPSVSEQMMTATLEGIRNRARTTLAPNCVRKFECKFCKLEVCSLKLHLLSEHLDEVVGEASSSAEPHQTSSSSGEEQRLQVALTGTRPNEVSSLHLPAALPNCKCGFCGKLVATILELQIHFAKEHNQPVRQWKCAHCQRDFTTWNIFRGHLLRSHPVVYYRESLPLGTSAQDFSDAVSNIVRTSRVKLASRNMSRVKLSLQNYMLVCPYCKKRLGMMYQFRLHLSRCHLPEVIDALRELRDQRGR